MEQDQARLFRFSQKLQLQKQAAKIVVGDWLINVGLVAKVVVYGQLTRITVISGCCKSCAFYWYDSTETLLIMQNGK